MGLLRCVRASCQLGRLCIVRLLQHQEYTACFAETAEREAQEKQCEEALCLSKNIPRAIIAEITGSCKVWSPDCLLRLNDGGCPMVRTICTLEANAGDDSGRRGHVNIEVRMISPSLAA